MAADPGRVEVDGEACPNCGGRRWSVGLVGRATTGDGGAFLDLSPAPLARCVACGLSGNLEKGVTWRP